MNKSTKLLFVVVTAFLLAGCFQVECRRTYSSRSSSSGRGNRGKNQPSNGGLFGSWFGGSKSSGSSSGSVSKPSSSSSSSSTSAKKNWQTATSHASSQPSKSSWANPYYKPSGGSAVPSAPKETNYGWKPATSSNSKVGGSALPSSNIGSRGYPVQSGVQQSNYGGFKPAPSAPNAHSATNYQPSQSGFGGYKPASGVSNTQYQPSSAHGTSSLGGYHPAPGASNTAYKPANTYQPSHSVPHQPSYGAAHPPSYSAPHQPSYGASHPSYYPSGGHAPSYHPSGGHAPSYHPSGGHAYPQQPSYSGHYPSSFSGYPSHATFGSSVPSYQGTKLFGGSSGSYSYPGSGNWGLSSYGSKRSSGTGKLLTGLAVGAAGGYLTSSLVNRITNPWKYSGYGYGSGFGYGSSLGLGSGLGIGSGIGISDYGLSRSESAFERGYERGVRDRNEKARDNQTPAPAAAAPEPDDPSKNWINCVAFDPQTQQTLINPNCSCTVTTSQDERTGQPISVHHCTTLNGLVLKPIPIQPFLQAEQGGNQGVNQGAGPVLNEGVSSGVNQGINQGVSQGVNQGGSQGLNQGQSQGKSTVVIDGIPISFGAYGPPPGLEVETSYGNTQYGGTSAVHLPSQSESKSLDTQVPAKIEESTSEAATEKKMEESTTENKSEGSSTAGTVILPQVKTVESVTNIETLAGGGNENFGLGMSSKMTGVREESNKSKDEFFGQLQKIVNMGNFVDGG